MVVGTMLSPLGIVYIYGFWLALPLTAAAAFRWADWPERAIGLAYLVALIATVTVIPKYAAGFFSLEAIVLFIDVALVLTMLVIAAITHRGWLIWATAFQIIGTLGHLSKMVVPGMSRTAYAIMEGASGWPTLLALMIGIWLHRSRAAPTRSASSQIS